MPAPAPAPVDIVNLIILVLSVLINIWILVYLVNLEQLGCACAMGWRRVYIMMFTVLNILITLGFVHYRMSPVAMYAYFAASIVFIVVVMQYTSMLKREKCKCSEHLAREVMHIAALIQALIYIFVFCIALALILISLGNDGMAAIGKRLKKK